MRLVDCLSKLLRLWGDERKYQINVANSSLPHVLHPALPQVLHQLDQAAPHLPAASAGSGGPQHQDIPGN